MFMLMEEFVLISFKTDGVLPMMCLQSSPLSRYDYQLSFWGDSFLFSFFFVWGIHNSKFNFI